MKSEMKPFKSYLLFVFLGANLRYASSWGPIGHSIITRLAQSQLTDSAPNWIRSLTPWHLNGNLSALGSWADDILYADTNPTGYGNWQWTRPLHYINLPSGSCDYQSKRDCVNETCVAGAIRNYTKILQNEFDHIQLTEALYFLIHYVGDIHQPLHTGYVDDLGGNRVRGRYMNGSFLTNLHSLWDQGLINTRLRRDFRSNTSLYYDYINEIMQNQSVIECDNDIEEWIKENLVFVCSEVYRDEANGTMSPAMNFTLGEEYYQRSIPIIEQRLAHGGRRLGALLNQIAKNRPEKSAKGKDKLCAGTIALIVILSVEFFVAIVIGAILWFRYKSKSSKTHSYNLSPKDT